MKGTRKMNRFKSLMIGLALLLSASAFGQTILTTTTLSSAVSDTIGQKIVVASATGITAPSTSDNTKATILFVDREAMDVSGVVGTTITVGRGRYNTAATKHASSALVFIVPAFLTTYIGGGVSPTALVFPAGSCTRASELVLPRIYFPWGLFSDCNGGQWVNGDAYQTQRTNINQLRFPDPGGTAYTALETNGTAPAAATEIYCTQIDLPYSKLITGIASLNGTTVATDKHWVILYDSAGAVLANSATAGATTANGSTYQKFNFVTPYYAVGPARYFGCVGTNGTTDTIRHAVTGTNDNILGGTVTGQVFGTAAAITVPSSFTTAKVPYISIF
jgi:hypothetical protein